MFGFGKRTASADDAARHATNQGMVDALLRVQAVIWFTPDGMILDANDNFCRAVGYDVSELVGKHHRMFVEPDYVKSSEYAAFWEKLASGSFHEGQYKRVRKDGTDLWIHATYNPVFDANGNVDRIVKFATDVTQRRQTLDAILTTFQANTAGDLSARIPRIAGGELAILIEKFNDDLDVREKLVRDISHLAESIGRAGTALAQHSQTNVQVNATQSEGLVQTLDAVKSVEALVNETVDKLRNSRRLASEADDKSGEGHRVVSDATEVIGRIKEGSTRIENIVGVIDSIAFQTNLLSLNASVEAARAGEAGRGFAVVAQEVRTLAQDTAREASEIRELVKQSVEDISQGVAVVERVGEVLSEIKISVSKIVDHTAEINEKCDAQVEGITDAAEALSRLEHTGHRAADSARDNADSINDLAARTEELDRLVRTFGSDNSVLQFKRHSMRAAS